MDTWLVSILVAIITAIGGIVTTVVGIVGGIVMAYINKAEKSVTKAEKSIKEISGNLPSWELLFEHDDKGNPIKGNIERLIEAVGKGYPIKVRIHQPDNSIEVMDAQWLFVDDKLVHATNTNQISLTKNESGNYVYQKDSYHYYVIVGSDGHHHATRISVDMDGKERKQTDLKRHMAWIGLVPPSNR